MTVPHFILKAMKVVGVVAVVGIRLNELQDLVAATADYSPRSDVILEKKKITVIEHTASHWTEKGVEE